MTKTDATPTTEVVKPKKDKDGNTFHSETSNGLTTVYLKTKDGRQLENTADTAEDALANLYAYLKS